MVKKQTPNHLQHFYLSKHFILGPNRLVFQHEVPQKVPAPTGVETIENKTADQYQGKTAEEIAENIIQETFSKYQNNLAWVEQKDRDSLKENLKKYLITQIANIDQVNFQSLIKKTEQDIDKILDRIGKRAIFQDTLSKLPPDKAQSKEYQAMLKELSKAGVTIDQNLTDSLDLDIWKETEYFTTLKNLQAAGLNVDSYVIKVLDVESAKDTAYIDGLIDLQKGGIRVDSGLIRFLNSDDLKNAAYRHGLIALDQAGIGVDTWLFGTVSSPLRNSSLVADKDYINGLISLKQAGIIVNSNSIEELDFNKVTNPAYLNGLIRLSQANIKIDEYFISKLGLTNGENTSYINGLKKLSQGCVDITTSSFLELDLEEVGDPQYVETIIRLYQAGVGLLIGGLQVEEAHDSAYVTGLNYLHAAGINVPWIVRALTLEKGKNQPYLQALKYLHDNGLEVQSSLVDSLDITKASDQKYLNTLKALSQNGIKIDGRHILKLGVDKANDPAYINVLKDLHQSGLNITSDIISELSLEKSKDSAYCQILKDLSLAKILINGSLIVALNQDKAKDQTYIEVLKTLQQNNIAVSGDLVQKLTLSQSRNKAYIDMLIDLSRHGITIDTDLMDSLSSDKWENKNYLQILKNYRIRGAHIEVNKFLINHLTVGKANNQAYMEYFLAELEKLPYAELRKLSYSDSAETFHNIYKDYLITIEHLPADQIATIFDEYGAPSEKISLIYKIRPTMVHNAAASDILDERETENILPLIREVNDLHDQPLAHRLEVIKDIPLEGLYGLVINGTEELFTSSFRDVIFPHLIKKMAAQKLDAADFIQKTDPNFEHFSVFMQMCSKFNKLEDLLSTIKDEPKKEDFLKKLIEGLDHRKQGLQNAVAISETLESLNKNPKLTAKLEAYLKTAYETAGDKEKILYGIISALHGDQAQTEPDFFKDKSREYPVPDLYKIDHKNLLNSQREIIQQYFFYDDEDGVSSFNNLLNYYRQDKSWQIQDFEKYIIITKKNPTQNITVIKYINKPTAADSFAAVKEAMKNKDLSAIQVVHRGHSYHAASTIDEIPAIARLVYLGSCGGFDNIGKVLEKAPQAHIISTKGEGTKVVNGPLLKLIDETMIQGKDLEWNELWQEAGKKINDPRFDNYVNPARNTAVQFINAYKKYSDTL